MMHFPPQRGFTLLIAVVLTSVVLSVGLSLAALAYKDVVLASSAKNSSYAFYAADSALECALYADQRSDAFNFSAPATSLSCAGTAYGISAVVSGATSTDTVPTGAPVNLIHFNSDASCATVTTYKDSSGHTQIFATGYDTCNLSDPRLLERGIHARY